MPGFVAVVPKGDHFGITEYGTPNILSVTLNGTIYALDDGTFCYWLGSDGLGMSPLHRMTERGPLQDGDSDRGFRLDPRMVILVLEIEGTSRADLELKRMNLLSIFKPSNTAMTLSLAQGNGTFCLDCHCIGGSVMPSVDQQGWSQKVGVQLKANDPAFYDPVADTHIFTSVAGADTCEVPTVIPMTVGAGATTITLTEPVTNEGTNPVFPIIRLNGPLEDPVVTNNTTGEKLDFTGTHIAAADYYEIDLRYGYKTVKDKAGVNKIATLTSDSDLVSWHLEANPEAAGGINSISVYAGGLTGASLINLIWNTRYVGI